MTAAMITRPFRTTAPRTRGIDTRTATERIVAGKILDGGAEIVARVRKTGLIPEKIADPAAAQVVATAYKLIDQRRPVDSFTISQELARDGTLRTVGGLEAILELVNAVPNHAGADYHAALLVEAQVARDLRLVLREIADDTERPWPSLDDLIARAEAGLEAARRAVAGV